MGWLSTFNDLKTSRPDLPHDNYTLETSMIAIRTGLTDFFFLWLSVNLKWTLVHYKLTYIYNKNLVKMNKSKFIPAS